MTKERVHIRFIDEIVAERENKKNIKHVKLSLVQSRSKLQSDISPPSSPTNVKENQNNSNYPSKKFRSKKS